MFLRDLQLFVSPTDLSHYLACQHRTALELSVAYGVRTRPHWDDPMLDLLLTLGQEHERRYVDRLHRTSKSIADLSGVRDHREALARTRAALLQGTDIVVQAAFEHGRWFGRPDVLIRIDRSSRNLGAWSYEVADAKLARETRGGTILQLGLYCEMLEALQGLAPDQFHVVTPGEDAVDGTEATPIVRTYRVADYAAYFRLLKARLEGAVADGHRELEAATYPEPVDHCDICPWIHGCADRRRADDHLSLVAGISRVQRRELQSRQIATMADLAALGHPMPFKPRRGAVETYERVRDQARLQVRSRQEGRIVFEIIPPPDAPLLSTGRPAEPVGLARLPEPSSGDVFLDLEGDPLAGSLGAEQGQLGAMSAGAGGREYLFGLVTVDPAGHMGYQPWWADSPSAERLAFEAVVDLIMARWRADPAMHVYHYAPYEPSAFKRLMGRYATREREIDRLLRGRRFVDLYAVVRRGVRAGVERYSIKNMEPLYAFTRGVALADANRALRIMEQALELDQPDLATPEVRSVIAGYNRDDCVSTLRLRDWLEARRTELISRGTSILRPPLEPGEESVELDERAKRVEALRARLLDGVHDDPVARSPDEHARYLLAYLLDWHRREDKASWWEYYRLRELPEEDLLEEPGAVAGLEFVEEVRMVKRSFEQRYRYPPQEIEIHVGDTLKTQDGKKVGETVRVDRSGHTIDILVGPRNRWARPTALFAHDHVTATVIEDALYALGERTAEARRVDALDPGPVRALLLRETPRRRSEPFAPPRRETGGAVTTYAERIVTDLDRTALAIQGPPGSGKTYTGARMICQLVRAGRKVGVTATSHKVITNLLQAVEKEAARTGQAVRLGHKVGDDGHEVADDEVENGVLTFSDNDEPRLALESGKVQGLGGTAWLWARPEYADSVDVLFVDEAGQMSLANVLGAARAATNLVLLGDPQQLEQPSKGSHPDGVGVSALQHVLGNAATMPEERGLFLPITWRLAPAICAFTSELFYEQQLASKPGLERQILRCTGRFDGAGLFLVQVDHEGNRNASDEEAAEVVRIVGELIAPDAAWVDDDGVAHRMTPADIRVVAPFNAHVTRIREALDAMDSHPGFSPAAIPVGTVDKFQGQEAPVVIYSTATSRPEDAPRGMEFLYSLNRLNVATSRARCACVLVTNPRLFEPECRTPRQMRLANALCRFREMATQVG